jgi:hypothetical protein
MNPTTTPTSATCTCVICGRQYIAAKATAERRGFCTRACEKVLEKKHGLHKRDDTMRARAAKFRALDVELDELRRRTPGADLPPTRPDQAKALLMRLLEEAGVEPFFHFELEQQERRVKAATLLEILESAFNLHDSAERCILLAPHFEVAIAQANRGDERTLRRALAAVREACGVASAACCAAQN